MGEKCGAVGGSSSVDMVGGVGGSKKIFLTTEQIKRIEENRSKAKALYDEKVKKKQSQSRLTPPTTPAKHPHSEIVSPRNLRDARNVPSPSKPDEKGKSGPAALRPASAKFASFVEYDFSKMTDTKGGFLSTIDDPLSALDTRGKPENMPLEKWSEVLLRQKLKESKQGAHAPHLSELVRGTDKEKELKKCWECQSWEIDWKLYEVFRCRVCNTCKDKLPEKYSLLTKTECKEDYLITDPELKDTEILPHLTKPNPHKSTWNDMQLFLRYQVEARAIAKWGSFEALDAEFEKRAGVKRRKKEEKFKSKLKELKNKTRVETWKRKGTGGDGMKKGKHEHVWGLLVENGDGMAVRTCEECGFEVEELVL